MGDVAFYSRNESKIAKFKQTSAGFSWGSKWILLIVFRIRGTIINFIVRNMDDYCEKTIV